MIPPYSTALEAKQDCYPPSEHVCLSDTHAEVRLQALMNKTTERLFEAQKEVVEQAMTWREFQSCPLICKWGCDGSSGHSTYKQKFVNLASDDGNIFVVSAVPLRLKINECERRVLWQNPRTSSTRFCRPVKVRYVKETAQVVQEEYGKMENQIKQLVPTIINVAGKEIAVSFNLQMTMVDGKICNILSGNKCSQRCYVCGRSGKELNDDISEGDADLSTFSFGLSTLHAWIRTFELLLHVSYKLNCKKWIVRGDDEKRMLQERKRAIQQRFRKEMGLLIDRPKPGSGNTNDGNTARTFFRNGAKSASLTGLNKDLIEHFRVILETLASGFQVNFEAFEKYAKETKDMFVRLYPWYNLSPTVHKVLVHGADIMKSCELPIGQMSEEVQEARVKDIRRFRESHTRKISRTASNQDLLNMLLVSSDPVISSIRKLPKKRGRLSQDVLRLLCDPEISA